MAKLLDANIIVRYLLKDDTQKADAVENLLKSGGELVVTDVTVSELVWVLSSFYKVKRETIAVQIEALLLLPNIISNQELLLRALRYYKTFSIDWIDCYLASYSEEHNLEGVYSYDRDLDKIPAVTRFEPGPLDRYTIRSQGAKHLL